MLLDTNYSLNYTTEFCPDANDDQINNLLLCSFFLEGVLQFIISVLGMLGNIAAIFLLTRSKLSSFFNQLLAILASYDLIYLFTMVMESVRRLGFETDIQLFLFPFFLYPLNSIALTGSIFMTVALATERYIAVYFPLHYHKVLTDTTSHRGRFLTYLLPITLIALIVNIPKFLESKVSHIEDGESFVDVTDLRTNHIYITYYHNWFRLLFLGIIPFFAISFLNTKIYIAVRRRRNVRRNKEEHMSVILILIITIFLFCHLPRLALNMHETFVLESISMCENSLLGGFPHWIILTGFISHVFLVINSSANLLIYCILDPKFREQFLKYFCFKKITIRAPQALINPENQIGAKDEVISNKSPLNVNERECEHAF